MKRLAALLFLFAAPALALTPTPTPVRSTHDFRANIKTIKVQGVPPGSILYIVDDPLPGSIVVLPPRFEGDCLRIVGGRLQWAYTCH